MHPHDCHHGKCSNSHPPINRRECRQNGIHLTAYARQKMAKSLTDATSSFRCIKSVITPDNFSRASPQS
jgi:hypothetical protein